MFTSNDNDSCIAVLGTLNSLVYTQTLAFDTERYHSTELILPRKQRDNEPDFILICKLLKQIPVLHSNSALQCIPVTLSPIRGFWYINSIIHSNTVNAKDEQVWFFQVWV